MSMILLGIVLVLFSLKILWNLAVPYMLAVRGLNSSGQAKGISLMPAVELILLALAVLAAWTRAHAWPWSATGVALYGSGIIVGSYVHLFAAGAIAGWLAKRIHR